jgi:hypothetical protein
VWLYLSFTTSETIELNASVSIRDSDKLNGLFYLSTLRGDRINEGIKISVTGQRKEIRIIKQKEIICTIGPKISGTKKEIQELTYQIKDSDFNLQEFDSLAINIIPEQEIRIKFVPFVEKTVPIHYPNPVYREDTLKEGHVIDPLEMASSAVVLVPIGDEEKFRSEIERIGGVPVKPLMLSSEGIVTLALEMDNSVFARDLHIQFKKKPVVRLIVEKKLTSHMFANVPIRYLSDSVEGIKSIERSVEECSVVVEISEDDVTKLSNQDIYCYVVLNTDDHLGKQKVILPINAMIASDKKFKKYRISKIIPESVEVVLEAD